MVSVEPCRISALRIIEREVCGRPAPQEIEE